MLKLHQIIRPVIPSNFFEDTVDWWLGLSSGHLGEQMYQQHKGKRSGQPMSGVLTWAEHARYGTIPRQSQHAFSSHLDAVIKEVGKGLPIVEFGPGSMRMPSTLSGPWKAGNIFLSIAVWGLSSRPPCCRQKWRNVPSVRRSLISFPMKIVR